MEKNDIYMMQGKEYKQMAVEMLRAVRLADDIGDRNKRIGLKPNLVVAKKASEGGTTHPELVDGIITYLKDEGFSNIVVLEGSWVGDLTSQAVRVNGIYDVCKKHRVPFVDLQEDRAVVCQAAGMQISICREALNLDYLINMPVLKGHCQTRITCALKNMKGLIPNAEKRRFHTLGLHKPIAQLNTVIPQDFILVDNICGDLDFEEGGNPVVMDRILCLKDPVLCDSFAAESMGFKPYEIEYIRLAEKLGVGSSDVSQAKLHPLNQGALDAEGLRHSPRIAQLAKYAVPKDACSACYGSLIYALERLKEEGKLTHKKSASIAIGQGYQKESGKLGIGQCTSCFQKSLHGCPPKAVDILEFLREEW